MSINEFLTATHSYQEWVDYCRQLMPLGADTLFIAAEQNGFFLAPASTKYHGAHKGGLVKHSLGVLMNLEKITDLWGLGGSPKYYAEGIIAAFFHDRCKEKLYKQQQLWRKDENGKWESYTGYVVDDGIVQIGHGPESLRLIEQHYHFENECWAQAVAWHMGLPDDWLGKQQYSRACERYPEVLALHTADAYTNFVMGL